jgi:hypothetical protein
MTTSVFVAPWRTGTATLSVMPASGQGQSSSLSVPIASTSIPFDVASRFATQATFGPRPDVVQHIQQIGLQAFLAEQMQQPALPYPLIPGVSGRLQYLRGATAGNSLLRLRVATALSTFLVNSSDVDNLRSYGPWERKLEADSFGNFRDLLTDITADARMGVFLNLAGNVAPSDPNIHPNQNFAREILQLFSIGPVALNEDGSAKLDGSGKTIATYDQSTILDLSRALTGWEFAPAVNPDSTVAGLDYSQPLAAHDDEHDHGSKTLFGSVQIPAGQDIVRDRVQALDTIFQHPNTPPFISYRLIQHLVTSNPSPAYVQRISNVFKDNGKGVRGDLGAVVTAILLDPEARQGDTNPAANDGFLQDPLMFFTGNITTLQQDLSDDQPSFMPALIGQPFWYAPSVNGFYPPTYVVPGTSIVSPEFSLWSNSSITHRSQLLYGMVTGTINGFGPDYMNRSWLFQNFNNVPDLVDALNHLVYHGTMPSSEITAINSYCAGMGTTDLRQQFAAAIFLALNSDSVNVTH